MSGATVLCNDAIYPWKNMTRIGWVPGRRFGNEEIRRIPRSLLEELRVFPFPARRGKVKIFCFWDIHDKERLRTVDEALAGYIPAHLEVIFVWPMGGEWSSDPDRVLCQLLDAAHRPEP